MGRKCLNCVKAELNPRNFLLDHETPAVFVQFQCGYGGLYIFWRLLGVLVSVGLVSASVYLTRFFASSIENVRKWPIYLTNWSLMTLVVNSVIDCSISLYTRIKRKDIIKGECDTMPWYLKAVWVTHNISQVAAFSISILYWTLLYKPGTTFEGYKILPFFSHGVNSIYSMFVLLVSGIPTRLFHFYQPLIYSVIYLVFTVIYHFVGGTNDKDEQYIYSVIDWSTPSKTWPVALGAIVLALLTHCVVFLVASLRNIIVSKCCPLTENSLGVNGLKKSHLEVSAGEGAEEVTPCSRGKV